MKALEQLKSLLPDTPAPAPNELDRALLAQLLGSELPDDYVAFLDTFGGGEVEGVLRIYDPAAASASEHPLHQLFVEITSMNKGRKFTPWDERFLPWGVARDGTVLYFLRRGRPSAWPVAAGGSGAAPEKLRELPGSMTETVAGMLTGKLKVGKVGKPSGALRFVPSARATATKKTVTKKKPTKKNATKKKATKKKGAR